MMNFEEFKAWVKENITSKDWKETSQVEISVVKKNNGVSKAGLFIRESGQDVSPILYLDDYYIHYQNGELLENVIKKIRDDYNEKVQMAAVKIPNLQEFENVRGKIIYRLVNYEKNKELLEDCPHRRLHDLAVTFRWVAHIDNDGVSTSLITNRQVKEWGVRSRMGKCSVEKAKDEKRYAEKVDFVVKHLLEATDNQELNDFMGKDTDEAVLYNEADIRGVIAQMPELVFYEYYYKFRAEILVSPTAKR